MNGQRSRALGGVLSMGFLVASMHLACSSSSTDEPNGGDGGDGDASGSDSASDRDSAVGDGAALDAGVDAARPEPTTKLAAGGALTCAIVGGVAKCWGANGGVQLGRGAGDTTDPSVARAVVGLTFTPTMITAGPEHACASDGVHTACWGYNNVGQLGGVDAGACVANSCPSALTIEGIGAIHALASGDEFSCVVRGDGGVHCFGEGSAGELGNGGAGNEGPDVIPGVENVSEIGSGEDSTCARKSDGSVVCWGDNIYGELGQKTGDGGADAAGYDELPHPDPLTVPALVARQLSVGSDNACVVLADGTAKCWGNNAYSDSQLAGQLGHDPLSDPVCEQGYRCSPIPTSVVTLADVREVSAGALAACAIKTDDTVVCWGDNSYGELNAAPSLADAGAAPYNFTPQPMPGLTNVAHIVWGYAHACAVTWDDHVLCWGANNASQLGIPSANDGGVDFSRTPVTPAGL